MNTSVSSASDPSVATEAEAIQSSPSTVNTIADSRGLSNQLAPLARAAQHIMAASVVWLSSLGIQHSAIAAEKLVIRLGPIEQMAHIEDLETFAKTGKVPDRLKLYKPLLTDEARNALSSRMYLDPDVGNHLMDGLIQSASGKRVIELLDMAAPENTPEEFESALKTLAQETGSISLLGFLQAFPAETLTIDASSAIALASQFNLPQWQSHALNSVLERELDVETDPALPFFSTFDPTLQGPDNVRHQTLTFRDRERRRTIPVDLYWSRWTTGPLVIISHGFGADRRFLNYLANHLASHGITVASLEHPGSNVAWLAGITVGESGAGRLSEILPATEFIDRPKDVVFLLNELDRLNKYSTVLGDRLNTENVTVIGHSLGGYTALALAGAKINLTRLREFCDARRLIELSPADWLQCSAVDLPDQDYQMRDRRVTQILAMSPVMGRIFDADGLRHVDVPTIITSASQDSITPSVHQQLLPFKAFGSTDEPSRHRLLVAIGATHLSMGDPKNLNAAITQSIFLRERRWEETELMRRMMRGLTLAFVKQQTPEAELYEPFLSSDYVQSWSTETLPLRFNDEISESLENWLQMATVPLERVVFATMPKVKQKSEPSSFIAKLGAAAYFFPLVLLIPPSHLSLSMLNYLKRQGKQKQKIPKLW